ncbi:MAG TPA: L-histidine N(alpha)-methyltransferase, partial [Bryobacteraceae bacterium]|nr:L-histidine N(alpha)-methyltransferase [Bryobacteraceae bacterium]
YLNPGSASEWISLVESEGYPTYGHCKTGLQALFESEPWNQMLDQSKPTTAVMLTGGGAPTKDILFLRTLLGKPYIDGPISYYLVDISMYMLRESALWINKHLRSVSGFEKVALQPIHQDVLALNRSHRNLFHQSGKVIFAITGGTIGNFREGVFFRSLDQAAEDGDLLIVSADTIDGMEAKAIERTLLGKYDNPGLRQFVQPVVGDILNESNVHEPAQKAASRTKVRLEPGIEAKTSDVLKSKSVIVTLDLKGREITLATSTRYRSSQLIAYAAKFGWQAVCQIPSPTNRHYKQFLFRRNKAESTGTGRKH